MYKYIEIYKILLYCSPPCPTLFFSFFRSQATKMSNERTYIMVKPDGVARGLVGEIIKRFESKGFQLVGLRQLVAPRSLLEQHYADLAKKPFFPKLMNCIFYLIH